MKKQKKLTKNRLKQIIKEEKAKLDLESLKLKNKSKNLSEDSFKKYENLVLLETNLIEKLKKVLTEKRRIKMILKSRK